MENEEKYIREKLGHTNPFRVPEGYFDQLTSQVMSQLPERCQKSRVISLRKWYYAAACVAAVAIMGFTFLFHQEAEGGEQPVVASVETNNIDNSYIDDAADYAMLDNSEIYAYLADY